MLTTRPPKPKSLAIYGIVSKSGQHNGPILIYVKGKIFGLCKVKRGIRVGVVNVLMKEENKQSRDREF
jgi:hypothetical protein